MSGRTAGEPDPDPIAVVQAWREQAWAKIDPVAFGVIEALARRAAAQQGEARRLLARRVEVLLTEHAASHPPAPQVAATAPDQPAVRRGALAGLSELVDRLGRSPGSAVLALSPPPPRPLKAVTAFQGTWSRLRTEQRLRQALAQVPAMAGPMNSAHVVNRTLRAMRDLSPEYLDAFISHLDTLLWLEQACGAGGHAPRPATSAEGMRRPGARPARKA